MSALVCTKWLTHSLTHMSSRTKPRLPMNSLEHPIAVNDTQYSLTVRDYIRNQPNIACQTTKVLVCSTRRCQISANLMPYRHAESARQCGSGRRTLRYFCFTLLRRRNDEGKRRDSEEKTSSQPKPGPINSVTVSNPDFIYYPQLTYVVRR